MMPSVRVVVVDDHEVVRRGLEQVLANVEDLDLVASAANGEDAVGLLSEHRPDIVLMDLSMPGMSGTEATRQILRRAEEIDLRVRVIVLTAFAEHNTVLAAIRAGASGFLLKHASPEDLVAAIRSAHAGDVPLDPVAGRALVDADRALDRMPHLTARESEVLNLVAQGLANKQIAGRLGIRERTVKAHLTSIFQALGVQDRTQAALWARDRHVQ